MGSNVSGFKNEDELIEYLNNKKVKEINQNMKKFILSIFDLDDEEEIIQVVPGKKGQKPDMEIIIKDQTKKISIKKGTGNSVHQENIDLFIEFLREIKISENTINELLKFHWGDGTCDGTGSIRISSSDYKKNHNEEIKKINEEFNKKNKIEKFINRFIIQGKSNSYDKIDALYYGNVEKGYWATQNEIIEYFSNNMFKWSSINFGPLTYQIWNRCLNFNPKTEERRKVMQVKWASLYDDLLEIERKRKYE